MVLIEPAAPCRLPLTETAFCAWVGAASPGDQLAYHRGYLAIDTGENSSLGTQAERQELRRVADRAWHLAQEGALLLVQRRHSDADYSYLALVRWRPREAAGALRAVLEQAGLSDFPGAA